MHLRLDSKSLARSFSTVAYSLLPTSPTKLPATKTEDLNATYLEKKQLLHSKKHSRSTSLAAIGGGHSSSRGRCRRISFLTALALLAGVGLVVTFGIARHSQRVGVSPDVQFDHRHRIAVDFETTDVPDDWSCNPFKEPGRMLSDDKNPVSLRLLLLSLESQN